MCRRLRIGPATSIIVVALTFLVATPAKADIYDCIEAVAPLDKAKQAAEAAAQAAQCVGQASGGDPLMVTTIAAMTALYAGGAFSNTEQCMGVIDSMIGKMLATALVQSGLAKALGNDAKKQLEDLANGVASQSFTQIVNSVPALQVLLMYVTCGCQVAGLPGTYEQIANEYKQSVDGCLDFASDAAEAVVDAIESGVDAVGDGLKVVTSFLGDGVEAIVGLFEGDDEPACPINVVTKKAFGAWTYHKIDTVGTCGAWVCEQAGYNYGWVKTKITPKGTMYTCSHCPGVWALDSTGQCQPCGGTTKKISADQMCLTAESGFPTDDGAHCTKVPSQPNCCVPGQRMISVKSSSSKASAPGSDCLSAPIGGQCFSGPEQVKCVGACSPPQYFDSEIGMCASCPPQAVPVYNADPFINSVGSCKQCPPGLTGEGNMDCQPCPSGLLIWGVGLSKKQVSLAAGKQTVVASGKQSGGTPAPRLGGADTVARPSPAPPSGSLTALPAGPMGLVEGGRCVACPEHWTPVYDSDPAKSSLGRCVECPPGTYISYVVEMIPTGEPGKMKADPNWSRCRPCPAGFDPLRPHVCLATNVAKPVIPGVVPGGPGTTGCPAGARMIDGVCAPPSSTLIPGRRLVCPAGQLPNAAGTSCVRVSRTRPGDRVLTKAPTGTPTKIRPSRWLTKRRVGPPVRGTATPR